MCKNISEIQILSLVSQMVKFQYQRRLDPRRKDNNYIAFITNFLGNSVLHNEFKCDKHKSYSSRELSLRLILNRGFVYDEREYFDSSISSTGPHLMVYVKLDN